MIEGEVDFQKEALNIIRSAKRIFNGVENHRAVIAAKIGNIQRDNPRASEIKAIEKDGQIFITDVDDKITSILGYTPDELKDKPISNFVKLDDWEDWEQRIRKVKRELANDRTSLMIDTCIHKDGHEVEVLVCIYRVGENEYREFITPVHNIIRSGTK